MLLDIIVILALIACNGFFAMSELAVVSSRRQRLAELARRRVHGARAALDLAQDPSRFLPTVQVGITLAGIFAGAFGGAKLEEPLVALYSRAGLPFAAADALAIATMVVAITYLSLILGELVPKQLALRNPERVAATVAPAMELVARSAAPFVWFLDRSTHLVLRLFRVARTPRDTVTDEEIKTVIAEGAAAGVLHPRERDMLSGVMRLADWHVRALMTPRSDVHWIDLTQPEAVLREEVRNSRFSRVVAARGSLADVVGVIEVREFLRSDRPDACVQDFIRRVPSVRDTAPALSVLDPIRESLHHTVLVRDADGAFIGLVAATDVLKAIVGSMAGLTEIGPQCICIGEHEWLIDGEMAIDVVAHLLDLRLADAGQDYGTLAGLILHRLEHVPTPGEAVSESGFRFVVESVDGTRVRKVLATREAQEASPPDD